MSKRRTHHIKLHYVLPPDQRDEYRALPQEAKDSWRNALLADEQIDQPGEPGNYFIDLTDEEAALANSPAIKNVAYAVPAEDVHAHGDPDDVEVVAEAGTFYLITEDVEEDEEASIKSGDSDSQSFAFPDPQTMVYHKAKGTEKNKGAGKNRLVWHLDTGVSAVMERMTPGGVVFRRDYTGGGTTEDRNGHGSMSASLAVPLGAKLAVCKVLGDNGSGSSVGIVAAIRDAAKFVRENPEYRGKTILTGSLGGPPGKVFQPYVDACSEAEAEGIVCLWSAGNDGAHAISAPANWREDRASIAFNRPTDAKASFSNHSVNAGCSSEGQQILMLNKIGSLVRGNGTSFSLPIWVRHIVVVSWMRGATIRDAFRSTLATARNTDEPTEREGHGVVDTWKAINKLQKSPQATAKKLFEKFTNE